MSSEEEVEKLAIALQEGPFRHAFYDNPTTAMENAGIDASQIPADFLNTLRGLSRGELNAISRATRELRDKGMQDESSLMRMPL